MRTAGGSHERVRIVTNKMYTELSTALSTAQKVVKEADLLRKQLEDRMGTLEHRTRELETEHKHLALEWEELYDKVRKAMARVSKRAARAEQDGNGALSDPESLPPPEHVPFGSDPISQKILARRGVRSGK